MIEDLSQQRLPARMLVALLQSAGFQAQLVNLNLGLSEIVALAPAARPPLIVGSILFADRVCEYLTLMTMLQDARLGTHLTLAGPLPSLAHEELLAACPTLDSVIVGEAEAAIVSLATHARDHWQTLDGIASRSNPHPTPARISNTDALPHPARAERISTRLGYGFATVESSSGCYHHCAFCLPRAFYRQCRAAYRMRTITDLVDEIEQLYHRGTRLFLFDDEQFLAPKRVRTERIAAFGEELARRDLNIAFTIKCRADDVDATLFRQLQELGLIRVYAGIESGCQASLDLFDKGTTVEQNVKALRTFDQLGLVSDFHILAFHPWSTLETIETEIDFLERVRPDVSTLFGWGEVEIYAGTPLGARAKAEGRIEGKVWDLSYTIADPRTELLRRLTRLTCDPSGAYGRLQAGLTEAWFDQLVQQRFAPSASDEESARELKNLAAGVNGASLLIWREMLSFVREGNIYNADEVNARAGDWARRINAACV